MSEVSILATPFQCVSPCSTRRLPSLRLVVPFNHGELENETFWLLPMLLVGPLCQHQLGVDPKEPDTSFSIQKWVAFLTDTFNCQKKLTWLGVKNTRHPKNPIGQRDNRRRRTGSQAPQATTPNKTKDPPEQPSFIQTIKELLWSWAKILRSRPGAK